MLHFLLLFLFGWLVVPYFFYLFDWLVNPFFFFFLLGLATEI